jgi:hypothetical protein
VPWLRYIASAVCFLQVQSTEAAWFLTPQEYWALYDMKMEMNKPPVDYTPRDAAVELEQDLRRRGLIE